VRLLICAGGTGGGVYPALAVHHALAIGRPSLDTLWIGGEGGMEEELVRRAGIPFRAIPAAGLHGVGPRAWPRNLMTLAAGFKASMAILREFKPDVLFFTGGYVAGPMALAGRRIPSLLYVPDIEPGLALKSLARFARRISVTAPDSQKYFSRKVITTGYPIRAELTAWNKSKGYAALHLDDEVPVLLIFGGSQGARSINEAIVPHLPTLLELAQIVHISGQLDWGVVQIAGAGLTSEQRERYHAFPYLHEQMGAALAAADLAISRAGASTLGEFPFFGLPAILVPYPHAWRYQKVNADYLAERGAAVILKDELLSDELLPVIKDLLANPSKRKAMSKAMSSLSHPQAPRVIAEQILRLGGERL